MPKETLSGFKLLSGLLDRPEQVILRDELHELVGLSPFWTPHMPRSGRPMRVRMTSLGRFGWYASRAGYVYLDHHPQTGAPFPPIPERLLRIWNDVTHDSNPPDSCLINYYDADAKMGLHADLDEEDRQAPVLSISLGDTALFRLGGLARSDSTISFRLNSGDLMILSGDARNAFHGIDRIYGGSSTLLKHGGRLNLTLRRVKPPKQG